MSVATATEAQLNAARAAANALVIGLQKAVQGDRPILAASLQDLVDDANTALAPLLDE